jgi:hypothetical protein
MTETSVMEGDDMSEQQTSAERPEEEETTAEHPEEEYLLYVRVPDSVDGVRDDTVDFLKRLAKLLSDDDHRIYVEEYLTYDPTKPKMPRGNHQDDGKGYRGNSPSGGHKNGLQPMYFCHNKF